MAKYNSAIEVTFNDNDGVMGWRANPEAAYDVILHFKTFGKWRTRWMMLRKFWRGMVWLEGYSVRSKGEGEKT